MSTKKAVFLITFTVVLLTVATLLVIYVAFDAGPACDTSVPSWEGGCAPSL